MARRRPRQIQLDEQTFGPSDDGAGMSDEDVQRVADDAGDDAAVRVADAPSAALGPARIPNVVGDAQEENARHPEIIRGEPVQASAAPAAAPPIPPPVTQQRPQTPMESAMGLSHPPSSSDMRRDEIERLQRDPSAELRAAQQAREQGTRYSGLVGMLAGLAYGGRHGDAAQRAMQRLAEQAGMPLEELQQRLAMRRQRLGDLQAEDRRVTEQSRAQQRVQAQRGIAVERLRRAGMTDEQIARAMPHINGMIEPEDFERGGQVDSLARAAEFDAASARDAQEQATRDQAQHSMRGSDAALRQQYALDLIEARRRHVGGAAGGGAPQMSDADVSMIAQRTGLPEEEVRALGARGAARALQAHANAAASTQGRQNAQGEDSGLVLARVGDRAISAAPGLANPTRVTQFQNGYSAALAGIGNMQRALAVSRQNPGLRIIENREAHAQLTAALVPLRGMVAQLQGSGIINPGEMPGIEAALSDPRRLEQMTFGDFAAALGEFQAQMETNVRAKAIALGVNDDDVDALVSRLRAGVGRMPRQTATPAQTGGRSYRVTYNGQTRARPLTPDQVRRLTAAGATVEEER